MGRGRVGGEEGRGGAGAGPGPRLAEGCLAHWGQISPGADLYEIFDLRRVSGLKGTSPFPLRRPAPSLSLSRWRTYSAPS